MTEALRKAQIRKARPEDGLALANLLRALGWFPRMASEPETVTQQTVTRHLEACLSSPTHSVYVAVDRSDQVVGYVAVHWLPYLFLPGPEGFVSDLFVEDRARGKGVGKSLLQAVEAESKARGCSRLQLINFRNRGSYRRGFYAKAGWEERPDAASFVWQISG